MRNRSRAGLAALLLVAACSNDGSSTRAPHQHRRSHRPPQAATTTTEAAPGYSAQITRTEYGIPHIVADDWGSLGFGQGYAFAQDRACTLLDQIIKVRGERAKWFGPGDDDANLDSDFAYRHLDLWDDADEQFADQPERRRRDGDRLRRRLQCRARRPRVRTAGAPAKPWVQPITTTDLYANMNDVVLFASGGVLIDPIATAQPPTTRTTPTDTGTPRPTRPPARHDDSVDMRPADQPGQQRLGHRRRAAARAAAACCSPTRTSRGRARSGCGRASSRSPPAS